jgi:hypothetical protein
MRGGRFLTVVFLSLLIAPLAAAAQDPKTPPPQEEKPVSKEEPKPGQEPPPIHDLPDAEDPARSELAFEAEFRVGGWWMDGFDATLAAGHRRIDSTLLFDAGLDLGLDYQGWTLTLGGDYATAKDLHLIAGSLLLGGRWPLGESASPIFFGMSAGPLFGKLEPDIAGFGEFKSALGFEGRVELVSRIHETIGIGFWASYRQITFKFDGAVLSGDTKAGGAGAAAGIGLLMRF